MPGIKRTNHANLGKSFEQELEAVHQLYLMRRIADIRKIPHRWDIISYETYQKLYLKLPASMLATTNDGKYMQRMKSDVDFIGGGKDFHIAFDAKFTVSNRFSLSRIEPHQLRKLLDRRRCGAIAGLMIKIGGTVFFADAGFLEKRCDEMLRASRGRALRGTSSLSIDDLKKNTIEILTDRRNGTLDYLPQILLKKSFK